MIDFSDVVPVILSGGSGTRLWPLSRSERPKQFIPLIEDTSLFGRTLERVSGDRGFAPPIVVGNDAHRFLLAEEARNAGIDPLAILLEPVGRNTAPAVAVAAYCTQQTSPGAYLLFLPSDHLVGETGVFLSDVATALETAKTNRLVCFGVVPTRPETGYGYIRAGASLTEAAGALDLDLFKEKPDLETAKSYLEQGGYYWNSGMFLFPADLILSELRRLEPGILDACTAAVDNAERDLDFVRLDRESFERSPARSVDHAVMEHTERAAVVPFRSSWSDIGSFGALWEVSARDAGDNAVYGEAITMDTRGSIVWADKKLVVTLGITNLVVIVTDDVVMVLDRDRDQSVKDVVDALKADARPEADRHQTVYRPWGCYRSLAAGDGYLINKITVFPGKRLALQIHEHRAEHWVVVSGMAKVTRDEDEIVLNEDQSVYLPLGCRHRLENPGKAPLQLIEVQNGAYLGEDDIVRLEDDFNR